MDSYYCGHCDLYGSEFYPEYGCENRDDPNHMIIIKGEVICVKCFEDLSSINFYSA